MFRGHDDEAVAGQVVADPAVDAPGAAQAMGEDDDRPLSAGVRPRAFDDRDVDDAVQKAEEGGEAGVGDEGGDVGHLGDAEVLGLRGPARPIG